MTKTELYDYIKSLNKNPGQYTDEELLDICLKHKKLDYGQKNWQELAEYLDVPRNGEGLRQWVIRQQKLISDYKEIEEPKAQDTSDREVFQDLYKAKTQVRDYYNAYRKDLREQARYEEVLSAIKESVHALNNLPEINYLMSDEICTSEAVLLLSDLHLGVYCNNFYNKYNVDIARDRLNKLADSVIQYCKNNSVRKLNICNLGDMVHGIIHTNARIASQFDTITATMMAGELIANFLNDIQKAAPEVIYRSCSDNHARLMANKEDNLEEENLGRIIDWFLEERLKGSNIDFVNDNLDYSFGKFKLMNNKNVIFSHGHLDGRNNCFQNYVGATREYIDYILLGHWHNPQQKNFQNCKVFINGSIVGSEDYAVSKRLFTEPSQTLLLFKDDDVINIDINLNIM